MPLRQISGVVLAVPLVFLLTGVGRAVWGPHALCRCSWGDATRALRIWFALSWVVTACVHGLLTRSAEKAAAHHLPLCIGDSAAVLPRRRGACSQKGPVSEAKVTRAVSAAPEGASCPGGTPLLGWFAVVAARPGGNDMVRVTDAAIDVLGQIDKPADAVLRLEPDLDAGRLALQVGSPRTGDEVVEREGEDILHVSGGSHRNSTARSSTSSTPRRAASSA